MITVDVNIFRQELKRMTDVFRWEWRYCRKGIWKQLLIQTCYPAAVFLLYYFHKEWLFRAASAVFSLPEEIYAFAGLNHSVTTGNIRFYILFGVMLLQIWIVWNACWRTLQLLQADERTGSICSMCNQWYSRRQLGLGKLFCSFTAFFLQNTLWYCIVLLFICMGSANGEQRGAAFSTIILLWVRSSLVTGMLICLTFCAGVFLKRPVRQGTSWVSGILVCSLLLGNLYKVRNLLQWFLEQILEGMGDSLEKLRWLDHGYWLSPLSWLNPYGDSAGETVAVQLLICAGIAAAGAVVGLKGCKLRRIGVMS